MNITGFTDVPDPVPAGGELVYTITVENSGIDPANDAAFTLPLPAGTSFVSVSPGSCGYSAPNIECNFGLLQGTLAGGSAIDIVVTLKVTVPGVTTINATATVSTSDVDSNPGNNSQSQGTTITQGADLILTKNATPNPIAAAGTVSYALTAENLGPNDVDGVRIVDTLPNDISYISGSGPGWTCGEAAGIVTCNHAGVEGVGLIDVLTITGQVNSTTIGTLTNSATVSSPNTADGIPANNTVTHDLTVTAGTDLSVAKSLSPNPAIEGDTATFTLAVINNGPMTATNVQVTDTIPSGFTGIVAAGGADWVCGVVGQDVTCDLTPDLAVGPAPTITITATAPLPASNITNMATVTTDTTDPVAGNDSGGVTFNILADGADLQVTKVKSPTPVAVGSNMTSTITLRNNGPRDAATGVGELLTVVDTLSANETYLSAAGSGWTCVDTSPIITCTRPGPLANGATAPSLSITTRADVADSSLANTVCAQAPSEGDINGANDCATAAVNATGPIADLVVSKTVSDAIIDPTENSFSYTITVTNIGPDPATNVNLTDNIPMFTAANAFRPGTGVSSVTSHGSCTDGSTVNCSLGTVAVGAPATVTITVSRPMIDGNHTNTVSAFSADVGDPNRSNNTDTAANVVQPVTDIQFTSKTVTPTSVLAGTPATYVLTVRNAGPSTAANVSVADVFNPTGVGTYTFLSATPSKGACDPFETSAPDTLDCNLGSLSANEVQTVTVRIRPDYMVAPPAPRILPNSATVSTTTLPEADGTNNTATANLEITQALVDMIINKSDEVDPVGYDSLAPGSNFIVYNVSVDNIGPSYATGVQFVDTITPPAGKQITFVCDRDTAGGACGPTICDNIGSSFTGPAAGVITCTVGEIDAGDSYSRYLVFSLDTLPTIGGDTYQNSVTVSTNEPENNAVNNTTTEQTTVRIRADLQLVKTVSQPSVGLLEPFSYTLTVTNNGPGDSQVTSVSDSLPSGLQLTGPPVPSSGTCTGVAGNTSFSCELGLLPVTENRTVTVPVKVVTYTAATVTNTGSVATSEVDLVPGNNSGSVPVTVVRARISGIVYRDLNDNGVQDAGETGIAGVQIRVTGTDAYGNVVNRTANTNASGVYTFWNMAASDGAGYTLTETHPAGYFDGLDNDGAVVAGSNSTDSFAAIALAANETKSGFLFGELPPVSIAGFAYVDVDNDGVRDAGETSNIAGVTVDLDGTDDLGNSVSLSTTTDGSGNYSFTNLRYGTYTLTETQPVGYLPGRAIVGSGAAVAGTADNNPASADFGNIIANLGLTAGQAATGYGFGELEDTTISGAVWHDEDNDGIRDAGETTGIAGVTITLTGTDYLGNPVSQTDTTDANGVYDFTNLNPGTYTLTEGAVAGYLPGKATAGTGAVTAGTANNNPVSPTYGSVISGISLGSGDTAINYWFGELQAAELGGYVWHDADNDGVGDVGESTFIAGVTVTLTGTDDLGNAVSLTDTTDGGGAYLFNSLRPGTYTLTETAPVGYLPGRAASGTGTSTAGTPNNNPVSLAYGNVIAGISLVSADTGVNFRFGELLASSLAGSVWHDANNNGVREVGETEGLVGVTLTLTGTDDLGNAISQTTTTDGSGNYSFTTLRPGTYRVTETPPAVYLPGLAAAGTGATVAGTPELNPLSANYGNFIDAVGISSNQALIAYGFGELKAASVAGSVWHDENNNGAREGTELIGINGVSVTLTGTDDLGNPISLVTSTAGSGNYSFTGLRPGNYSLTEGLVVGYLPGLAGVGPGAAVAGVPDNNPVSPTFGNVINNFTLASDNAATGYGFGELKNTAITGFVWHDRNNDGVRDPAETEGIAGVSITLTGTDYLGIPVNLTTSSDANGNYSFVNIEPGTYTLTESPPSSYLPGMAQVGLGAVGVGTADNAFSSADFGNVISGILLGSEEVASQYGFGELRGNSLAGKVWYDVDNDGRRESGEDGISGVTMVVSGTDYLGNSYTDSVTSSTDGSYVFSDLPPGTYTLTEGVVEGYIPGLASLGSGPTEPGTVDNDPSSASYGNMVRDIFFTSDESGAEYDFGELRYGSLAGKVFIDFNDNGVPDPDDNGVAGVTVTLTGTDDLGDPVEIEVQTNADGDFLFPNLRPGTYNIAETQPADLGDGSDTAGSLGGTVTDDLFSDIELGSGEDGIGYYFAELSGGIGGSVYVDSNNNGVRDPDEEGIAGVTLTLTGTDSRGNLLERSLTTDEDGNYEFSGLPASDQTGYILTESQPSAWVDGLDAAGAAGGTVDDDQISGIVIAGADVVLGYTFGEQGGSLSGWVYNDLDDNGSRGVFEPGIPEVVLTITGIDSDGNPVNATVITGQDGFYLFADLPMPDSSGYTIAESQPPDTIDGPESVGSFGGTVGDDVISHIVLPEPGSHGTDYNFAETLTNPASLSGYVWIDNDHDRIRDESTGQENWIVELLLRDDPLNPDGAVLMVTTTDADGFYIFEGLSPGSGYEVRFRHPAGNYVYGTPVSDRPGVDLTYGTIRNLTLIAGENVIEQSLPLDPSGIVYDAITRQPVAGASVTLIGPAGFDPALHLVGGAGNLTQITGPDGQYQYLLLPTAPAGLYSLTVVEPGGYTPWPSIMIPVCDNSLSIQGLPDPALVYNDNQPPAIGAPIHNPATCPTTSAGLGATSDSTQYYFDFLLTPGASADLVNNHIPLDPEVAQDITVTKTSAKVTVSRGDLVPYTITVTNNTLAPTAFVTVSDQIPPGFRYKAGSATLDGGAADPVINGRLLTWEELSFGPSQSRLIRLLLVVGSGVGEGDYANLAWAGNSRLGTIVSEIANATVRVVPDPIFDCTDIIGKVFDDVNANGYQDEEEPGLANVRLATARGLLVTTDDRGRFHVACGAVPHRDRGSNFIMKLDPRSLPSGYRLTTENPRVVRATRGKFVKLNFGAALHQVVRIDLNRQAFEEGTLQEPWLEKLHEVITLLRQQPSVLRLSYARGPDESQDEARDRLMGVEQELRDLWNEEECGQPLLLERVIQAKGGKK